MKKAFSVDATLIKGSGGIFDVTLDGELIFSKHDQDRFPSNEEIEQLVKDKTS